MINRFLCTIFKLSPIKEGATDCTKTLPLGTATTWCTQNSMAGCNGRVSIGHGAFKDIGVKQHIPHGFFARKNQRSFSPEQLSLDAPEISPTTIALVGQLEQRTRMSCKDTQQILHLNWPDMSTDNSVENPNSKEYQQGTCKNKEGYTSSIRRLGLFPVHSVPDHSDNDPCQSNKGCRGNIELAVVVVSVEHHDKILIEIKRTVRNGREEAG
mmetsp:Transcript_18545/g.26369  ORF Transcript_18545/g.26369 Transcript_18545/m.26369 type:complete len:212 (+) Transcript_18545:993-1628(+)